MRQLAAAVMVFVMAFPLAVMAQSGPTLEAIRARGNIECGVGEASGFAQVDDRGVWSGLDVDFCAGLAAAVLGDKGKVKYRPLPAADRFRALRSGEVDVLMRGATFTLSRDTELGIRFVGVLFHDGQGFLVRRSNAVSSVLELSGASICVLPGMRGEQAVSEYFLSRQMRYQLLVSERWGELVKSYAAGGCTLLAGDISLLALERSRLPTRDDHILLPETITKEPLGPAVRQGDDSWFSVVRWTLMALVAGEELGINSGNVDNQASATVPEVRRLLGLDSNLGQAMGLTQDWAARIIRQVGNYQEIFDRNLGIKSALRLDRGTNALWNRGGLMYAAPFR